MKKRILNLRYFTPKGKRKVGLYKDGNWIEVYPGETLLAHVSHREQLEICGLVECKGPKVYRSIKAAIKGHSNLKSIIRE